MPTRAEDESEGVKLSCDGFQETGRLAGRIAVVTGASSGIGRAIALALAHKGVRLCVVGRDRGRLAETAGAARPFSQVTDFQIDLAVEEAVQPLLSHLETEGGGLDILVHSAGVIHLDAMEHACIEDLDHQYATNVRAPYLLTQRLLPPSNGSPWASCFHQLERRAYCQAAGGGAIRRHKTRPESDR